MTASPGASSGTCRASATATGVAITTAAGASRPPPPPPPPPANAALVSAKLVEWPAGRPLSTQQRSTALVGCAAPWGVDARRAEFRKSVTAQPPAPRA